MQIEMNWNLFATPLFLFLLYLVLRYHLGQRFTEVHERLEENNNGAIERYKENKSALTKIGECVVALKIEMEKRITRVECDKNHDDLWKRIHEIERDAA
jgi:hypothetical protein